MNKPPIMESDKIVPIREEEKYVAARHDRRYRVVDAQFHYVPAEVFRTVEKRTFTSEEGKTLQQKNRDPEIVAKPATKRLQNLEMSLEHMDACGLDMAMIMMPGWTVAGLEVCRILNDGLAKAAAEHPGRFLPLAAVPFLEGQRSLDEMTRVKNELGMKGLSIMTNQRGVRLDDERAAPFFKKAMELRLPIVVHPPTQDKGLWGGTRYNMDATVAREYDVAKCFVEVLYGVLPKYPDLRFLFGHYGGGLPSQLGRIRAWYTPPERAGFPKEKLKPPQPHRVLAESGIKDYFDALFDRCYFDMAGTGGWMPEVMHALSVIKPIRLAFATDYPHEMRQPEDVRAYLAGIQELDIPEEDKANILSGNMLSLFNP